MPELPELPDFYQEQYARVNRAIDQWLPQPGKDPEKLVEGMRYAVLNGGKRLRGVLVLEAGKISGAKPAVVEGIAAAVELIHAYSLVHDDLPAMDDDDYRRGQPSVHKKYNEGLAILVGDALLTEAFGLLTRLFVKQRVSGGLEILSELTEAIGYAGLIGGQVLDLDGPISGDGLEELDQIHRWKTGALITVSLTAGARAGQVSDRLLQVLTKFGQSIGLAFQIKDDLLDVTADFATLGKQIGADEREDKLTYPRLLGIEKSQVRAEKLVETAVELLEETTAGGERLAALARFIIERDR